MAKASRKPSRRMRLEVVPTIERPQVPKRAGPLELLTRAQRTYANSIKINPLTISYGSAGCGKDYVALALAAEMLESHQVEQITIVRPLVEAGGAMGAFPGTVEEKLSPWMLPLMDILNERLGVGTTKYFVDSGKIKSIPLALMRGSTLKNAFVLLTEAQNATPKQMEMFLTRIGEDAKVVVDGDHHQSDLRGPNGLEDAIERLQGVRGVGFVEFFPEDCVRSGLCKAILERYEM
jgi:phosphate starvation-inducible protein PhoH and related proteins